MQTAVSRQDDGTIELTITIPWSKIKEKYDLLFEKALATMEVEGFRRGKAPKKLAEGKVDKEKVYQEVIKEVIPRFYLEAIKQENLQPIITPKIELLKAKENKDWQFKAILCEKPAVELGDYKKAIQELKQAKRTKIWIPGKTKEPNNQTTKQPKPSLNEVLDMVLKVTKVKIPQILLEEQVNRRLTDLLDQTQKLGLTIDQYLKAKGKTAEQLKEEYKKEAEKTLSLEFVLEKITEEEKITVSNQEIDQFLNQEKDKKVQEQLKTQKYYLASLLRRQKTLDHVKSLVD